ncbi:MAG TPA: class I SAM-dependent methyltransferase [Calidithermus sp.]|nr:class I SAM-dependent methyltransferase [Calidithermus sp.]
MLQAAGVSATFLALLDQEPLAGLCALDVGTGAGRLALALAPACRRVVGIDRDAAQVAEARRRAQQAGLANVEFLVADAERVEYSPFAPDLVVAHLCMSDAIAERAARALAPGRVFAAVAFHVDQWRETGRPSRFAYDEGRMAALLERLGFTVEHLEVERRVETFPSREAALAAVAGLEARWRNDGRWPAYLRFLEAGGRTLTRSHLVVKARRR